MAEALSLDAGLRRRGRFRRLRERVRACAPSGVEAALSTLSAALLIFSFPDFNLWPLAWVALVPLLFAVARSRRPATAFLMGWLTGTLFFYGSCYWLTHAMIRYGEIPAWIAFLLLLPGALIVGLFPGFCALLVARAIGRWGARMVLLAPVFWVALEWARLGVTGQLWNAVGYSQAYAPALIQTARWGGVYAVSFMILSVNSALAQLLLLRRERRSLIITGAVIVAVLLLTLAAYLNAGSLARSVKEPSAVVIAVQPNVPMEPNLSSKEMAALVERHRSLSERALAEWDESKRGRELESLKDSSQSLQPAGESSTEGKTDISSPVVHRSRDVPVVIVWPESPMYFAYARDSQFREFVNGFAMQHRSSVIFNSQEPAPAGGSYNAAVMVNEEGRLAAQYDKIRLLPFGEYVPLPRWLPGVRWIPVLVGDFTPGDDYPLMPLGRARAGVFICFESAFPSIARRFAADGADALINISNDGYLGQTPVMRQHLANTIFRAVENARPVVRVTNTGITAFIDERGKVSDETGGFQTAVRTWTIERASGGQTFYTRHGDLFVGFCSVAALLIFVATSFRKRAQGAAV